MITHRARSLIKNYGLSPIKITAILLFVIFIVNEVFQLISRDQHKGLDSQEITYIQKNARLAMTILSEDIQGSGYQNCSKQDLGYKKSLATKIAEFIGSAGIRGFNGSTSNTDLPESIRNLAKTNTDALLTLHSKVYSSPLVSGQLEPPMFAEGTANKQVEQNKKQPNALVPIDTPCLQIWPGPVAENYQVGRLQSNSYFISHSQKYPGSPALVRQSIVVVDGDITTTLEEITPGIENIQFQYGLDTSADGVVNEYRDANRMDINSDGIIDSDDWQWVQSVRIDMLLISQSPVFSEPQTVIFNGVEYPGLFMRQAVSTDVQLKNYKKLIGAMHEK